jgi:hypothetical protein
VPEEVSRTDGSVERFRPTSGRIMGALGVLIAAAVVVIGVVDREHGFSMPVVFAALFLGVLTWAAMLRPGLWATQDELVMRNMLETVHIPLGAIEQVAVRQVLAVSAGEKRYLSPAVGRSRKQALKSNRPSDPAADPAESYPAFVEDRISRLAENARARRGIALLSDEQLELARGVRRRPAWPEIAGLVVGAVGFVVSLAV